MKAPPAFLSCDWGTSQFRLRIVQGADAAVSGEFSSEDGAGRLAAAAEGRDRSESFRERLQSNVRALAEQAPHWPKDCPLVISGMASSSIGWHELPYARLPFSLSSRDLAWREVEPVSLPGSSHRVFLLSGVRGEWEIMRGEETQLIGLTRVAAGALLTGTAAVLLPGTHSKHVQVSASQMLDFQTHLTGELFQVLSQHSVLRHSVLDRSRHGLASSSLSGVEHEAFVEAAQLACSEPIVQLLFRVRTRQVLHGQDPAANRAYLSGLLIGAEMAAVIKRHPDPMPIILCGGEHLSERYELACRTLDLSRRLTVVPAADAQRLTALGHAAFLENVLDA